METNFSDYVTTETVMQAFSGAKDLAQAGAKATVEYVWADAIATIVMVGLFVISLTLILAALNFMVRKFDDEVRIGVAVGSAIFWIMIVPTTVSFNAQAIPTAINPAGSIIYKAIVKGGAQ